MTTTATTAQLRKLLGAEARRVERERRQAAAIIFQMNLRSFKGRRS
jgi:hypothetical protein